MSESLHTIREQIVGGDFEYLDFYRALHWINISNPSRRAMGQAALNALSRAGDWIEQAKDIGLISTFTAPNQPKSAASVWTVELTSLGKQICDAIKQYRNWLDHSDELSDGVTPKHLSRGPILDVGCGVGCQLMTFARNTDQPLFGCDLTPLFVEVSTWLAEREGLSAPHIVCSDGAALPYGSLEFDFVFSRGALDFMRVDDALAEWSRVLRPGGTLVCSQQMFAADLQRFRSDLKSRQWKSAAFMALRFTNGSLYHLTGKQMTLWYPGRVHNRFSPIFQTPSTMKKTLRRHGFEPITDSCSKSPRFPVFVATKNRPG